MALEELKEACSEVSPPPTSCPAQISQLEVVRPHGRVSLACIERRATRQGGSKALAGGAAHRRCRHTASHDRVGQGTMWGRHVEGQPHARGVHAGCAPGVGQAPGRDRGETGGETGKRHTVWGMHGEGQLTFPTPASSTPYILNLNPLALNTKRLGFRDPHVSGRKRKRLRFRLKPGPPLAVEAYPSP